MLIETEERQQTRIVMTACLRAALAWSQRQEQPDAWRELARMSGVICSVRGPASEGILPMDLVRALHEPLRQVIRSDIEVGDRSLLEPDGSLSDLAIELAGVYGEALFEHGYDAASDWLPAWARQRDEQVEREVFGRLISAGTEADYVNSRRFLIENPAGDQHCLIELLKAARATRVVDFGPIPRDRIYVGKKREYWWPCPECRWPMVVAGSVVRCQYVPHQARYRIVNQHPATSAPEVVRATSARRRLPEARDAAEAVCVPTAVWRFITVPGVSELDLERRLRALPGVRVELWPGHDRVDLVVRSASGRRWEVDVKDHVDPQSIADSLPSGQHVVVPDYRKGHLPLLRRLVPTHDVRTISSFVRGVRSQPGAAR